MKAYWIWLATRSKVSESEKRLLLKQLGDARCIYWADRDQLRNTGALRPEGLASLCDKDLTRAKELCRYCAAKQIDILTWDDSRYPEQLRQINEPPLVLYLKGRLPKLENRLVLALVGTRRMTEYGKTTTALFSRELSESGAVLVSGMAAGVDTVAAETVLQAGGDMIGVLGCSIDQIYPAQNRALFRQMEERGCLISEYPPNSPFSRWMFAKRNRIISGLAHGVLVTEAPEGSGALITAQRAIEQGRDLFAVPGRIDAEQSRGSNALLKDAAWAATSPAEILQICAKHLAAPVRNSNHSIPVPDKKSVDKKLSGDYSDVVPQREIPVNPDRPALTPEEAYVLAAISAPQQQVDLLLRSLDLPTATVMSILTMLTIKKYIRQLPGRLLEKI